MSDSICSNWVAPAVGLAAFGIFVAPAFGPYVASQKLAEFCRDTHNDEYSNKAHLLWAYPLGGIVNLVTVALQPVTSLISLIAAGVFQLLRCFDDQNAPEKEQLFKKLTEVALGGASLIMCIHVFFVRIFYPTFEVESMQ